MELQRNNKTNQDSTSVLITLQRTNIHYEHKQKHREQARTVSAIPNGKGLASDTRTALLCMLSFLMPYGYNFI
jgi:hypothetical protein